MDPLEAYKLMAPYYRPLVKDRRHFQGQVSIVKELVKSINNHFPKILDAACGTGDVLALLAPDYKHIAGADGSPEMLSVAISDPGLEGIPLSYCKWENLPSFFMRSGQFDLVFILGNSIAHTKDRACFEDIVSAIHDGLTVGGIMAFDIRDWRLDKESGNYTESGRSTDHTRDLGPLDTARGKVGITDSCSYSSGRQHITYEVRGGNYSETFALSYLPVPCNDALDILTRTGFVDCRAKEYSGWPYVVLIGSKA